MKIKFENKLSKSDLIFILLEEAKMPSKLKGSLPKKITDQIELMIKNGFDPKKDKLTCSLIEHDNNPIKIYLLIKDKNLIESARKIGSVCNSKKPKNISVPTVHLSNEKHSIQTLLEGITEGLYVYDSFLTEKDKQEFQPTNLSFISKLTSKDLKEEISTAQAIASSISFIKDMVNSPAIECHPGTLAKKAKEIAKLSSKIKVSVISEKQIIKNKLNLIHSVASGSGKDAQLITLEYKYKAKNKKPIMIVGKGVTFDAGGLNLKGTGNIDSMKFDMAGAATVLGLFKLLAELKLPIHVIGLVPAVENLVGNDAYKPGDIIKAYNGKTVEITNTDAEGRLIMADSLSYGIKKYKPESVMDLATLTGACIAALGNTHTGVITNNDDLYQKVEEASNNSGNLVWQLPLIDYYREKVNGDISDYKNYTKGIGAGTIMAAAFLEKFVSDTPWVHFDIAGTAFLEKPIGNKKPGATGEPLKLLYHFLKDY